jgi:hypothetical protein
MEEFDIEVKILKYLLLQDKNEFALCLLLTLNREETEQLQVALSRYLAMVNRELKGQT